MAYAPTVDTGSEVSGGFGGGNGTGNRAVVKERIKAVTYHATDHKLILDIEADQTVGSVKDGTVGDLSIKIQAIILPLPY